MWNYTVSRASLTLPETCCDSMDSAPQFNSFFFFNKMGKAGTKKLHCHSYKGCQQGGILLIWIYGTHNKLLWPWQNVGSSCDLDVFAERSKSTLLNWLTVFSVEIVVEWSLTAGGKFLSHFCHWAEITTYQILVINVGKMSPLILCDLELGL